MPRPAEDQPLRRRHFEIFSADLVILAVVGLEADAEVSADTHVHIGFDAVDYGLSGSEPLDDFFGIGPRLEDFFGGGLESSGEGKAWLGEHKSFSTKAARRSSCAVQKRW